LPFPKSEASPGGNSLAPPARVLKPCTSQQASASLGARNTSSVPVRRNSQSPLFRGALRTTFSGTATLLVRVFIFVILLVEGNHWQLSRRRLRRVVRYNRVALATPRCNRSILLGALSALHHKSCAEEAV
jgi:hypothetical protein